MNPDNPTVKVSLGEYRVRTQFNPSDDSVVQNIKERMAETLNYINENIKPGDNGEIARLKSLALTSLEESAMWAVKAATA